MKLYLTSYRIPTLETLKGMFGKRICVRIVTRIGIARQYYEQNGVNAIVLNDNQAYVVNGEKQFIDTGVYFGDENRPRS